MTASAHGYEDKEDTGKISYRYKSKLGMAKRKIKVAKTLFGRIFRNQTVDSDYEEAKPAASGLLPRQSAAGTDRGQRTDGRSRGGRSTSREKNKSAHGQGIPLGLEIVAHLYEHSAHLWLHIMSLNSIPSQLLPAVQMLAGTSSTRLLLPPKSFD